MKLQSVEYDENNNRWYSAEFIPNNPREVVLYTREFGTTSGYYMCNEWYLLRWNSNIKPLFWREMPRYDESKGSL